MPATQPSEWDVFSVREIAIAADVPLETVWHLLHAGNGTPVKGFVGCRDAVELVKLARGMTTGTAARLLFARRPADTRRGTVPLVVSGALHAGMLVLVLAAGALATPASLQRSESAEPVRLVFLSMPGPGGGGGGGGQRQPAPPPAARLKGADRVSSPVSITRPGERREADTPVAPIVAEQRPAEPRPEPAASAAPPVTAPVVSAAAEEEDVAGLVSDAGHADGSRGPGAIDGTGSGNGRGLGGGDGAGIGDGTIAGTGGGPYRPGSGITPPSLQREVKPTYTEEARRRGITGDVVMEVVIRADGSVGAVRITRGLGAGLDERAVEAVRQWQFLPARRHGTPVDVLVEIAVEFRLR